MIKKFLSISFLIISLVSLMIVNVSCSDDDSSSSQRRGSTDEEQTVGTYLWARHVRLYGADSLAAALAKSSVSEVYFLVKTEAGEMTSKKGLTSEMQAAYDYDMLDKVITAMHNKGIKVYAWMICLIDAHYLSNHPEAGVVHFRRGVSDKYVDPANSDYQDYLVQEVKSIADNYDVDGFIFDADRYLAAYFGWSDADYQRLTSEYGLTLDSYNHLVELLASQYEYGISKNSEGRYVYDGVSPTYTESEADALMNAAIKGDEAARAFCQMRVDLIDGICEKIYAAAGDLPTNFAFMSEACTDRYIAAAHYGQEANEKHIFGSVSPMLYSVEYGKDASWVTKCCQTLINKGYSITPSIQAYNSDSKSSTAQQILDDINAVTELGCNKYILFRLGTYDIAHIVNNSTDATASLNVINLSDVDLNNVTITVDDISKVGSIALSGGFSGMKCTENGNTIVISTDDTMSGMCDEGILKITSADDSKPISITLVETGSKYTTWNDIVKK